MLSLLGVDSSYFRYLALPGTDIFTRRRTSIELNWMQGERRVLDAGFGNGWFAYRAYKRGAIVTAVAVQPELITKARDLYNDYLCIPEDRLKFIEMNLYDIGKLTDRFDEIICYETLEHIRDDRLVCRQFHDLLKPGGFLHLCCPNAEHPRWQQEKLDLAEHGGHVRLGYTERSYRELLEPLDFRIEQFEGIGGPSLVSLQDNIQAPVRRWLGEAGAAMVALISIPFVWFDGRRPKVPFSIYVRAVRGEG
jgi:SAM-dependent methyltransferase